MSRRTRLSATIDEDALRAARQAVEAGRAESVSAWVNEAMVREVERLASRAPVTPRRGDRPGVAGGHGRQAALARILPAVGGRGR